MQTVFARAHLLMAALMGPVHRISLILAALCLLVLAGVVILQILGRFIAVPVVWANDIAGYALVATTFVAMAPTLRNAVHIRVTLVLQHVPASLRHILEVWSFAVGLAFASYGAWWCTVQVIESYQFGDLSTGLVPFPLWVPQIFMAVGFTTFALGMLEGLLAVLAGHEPAPLTELAEQTP